MPRAICSDVGSIWFVNAANFSRASKYEIHHIGRFDRVQEFASYARLVTCAHQSAGKTLGTGGAKMGNVHLKWASSEAAVLFLRHAHPAPAAKFMTWLEKQHGKAKALSVFAHKTSRVVYHMLARGTVFSMPKFLAAQRKGAGEPHASLGPRDRTRGDRRHLCA